MKAPVVVVGGGVIGLCVAYSLTHRGIEVCVVDRSEDGRPASWGNAGWVVPSLSGPVPAPGMVATGVRSLFQPTSPLRITPRLDPQLARWMWSFTRYCNASAYKAGFEATIELASDAGLQFDRLAEAGVKFDSWRSGLTFVALSREAAQEELDYLQPLQQFGYRLPATISDGAKLRESEPSLSRDVVAGLHVADERHVDPRSLLTGLREWLITRGVKFVDEHVDGFVVRDNKVNGVTIGGGVLDADAVVLASGAWTGQLASKLGVKIPLIGGKGYSFFAQPMLAPQHPLYLLEARTAVSPYSNGVRVAGTMELDGLRVGMRQKRLNATYDAARRYLDGWQSVDMQQPWAGLRPMTPDGLPVIGQLPATNNAFVATGHAMLGVTLGPATGERMAEMIVDGSHPKALEPFSVARFYRSARR